MEKTAIQALLEAVSARRIRDDLRYLCVDPLPYRTVTYTRPGETVHSLEEADRYISRVLEGAELDVISTTHRVQAFRCDESKPLHHWYASPEPDDPWYEVHNLEAEIRGRSRAHKIIQLVSHKDSMSWIDSPGAHDNACGTVVNLELARMLRGVATESTVRWLFCNEEHTPWTSRFAAEAAAERGDDIVCVLNLDALDGKAGEQMAAGAKTHAVVYSTEEGRVLAEKVAACAASFEIGLDVTVGKKDRVNDDDGMYINAGYKAAVMNIGSWPYGDSQYHLPGDVAERVDIENLVRSTRLILAAVLTLDAGY